MEPDGRHVKGHRSALACAVVKPLPYEMVEKILMHVVRFSDLLQCRLVSKLWHTISSSICRRRGLKLIINYKSKKKFSMESFCDDFQDLQNLPWSACQLGLWTDCRHTSEGLTVAHIEEFTGVFGEHVKSFTANGDEFEALELLLRGMPNLTSLTLDRFKLNHAPPQPLTRITTKLNKLNFGGDWAWDDSRIRHLEAILKLLEVPPNVVSVEITPHMELNYKYNILAQLISPLTNIMLKVIMDKSFLSMTTFRHLTGKNLRIVQLELGISNKLPRNVGRYTPFDASKIFLVDISPHLKRLKLTDEGGMVEWVEKVERMPRFTIPVLPYLEYLEINAMAGGQFSFIISPFITNQFPILGHVRVWDFSGCHELFDQATFPSVRKFDSTGSNDYIYRESNDWDLFAK